MVGKRKPHTPAVCRRRAVRACARLRQAGRDESGAVAVEAAVGLPLIVFLTLAAMQFAFVLVSAISIESATVVALSSTPVTGSTRAQLARNVTEQVVENSLCLTPDSIVVENVTISEQESLDRADLAAGTGPFNTLERGATIYEITAQVSYETPLLLNVGPSHTVTKTVHARQQVDSYVEVNVS